MNDFQEATVCRCCGSDQLFQYLDLGYQPLANSYHKGESLPHFPLRVNLCEQCFHSQLSIVVNPELMFKNYLYVSGTTQTFRTHCEMLANSAYSYCSKHTPRVLDIAANDGTLLGYFRDLGCEVQGVDPAENLRKLTQEKNIPVVVDYWGRGTAPKKLEGKFDIITGTNVFAHVHDVSGFLDDCKEVLEEDGIIILEFPYCDKMIEHCEFDTIYHEHLSYFLVNSFNTLVERKGFVIDNLLLSNIHGGSIRFYLRNASIASRSWKANELIAEEKKHGLLDKQTYINFATQVDKNKQDMLKLLTELKSQNKKVIGYGASAKGNTMLNYFGIDLDYIVDNNSMKWGYATPGRDILIMPPELMKTETELYIVILAWNFFDEIVKRIENITGKKENYICYVPTVDVK